MPMARLTLSLVRTDFRNITRDGLPAFLIVLPLLVALIYRFVIPDQSELARVLHSELSADLEPHRALLETLVGAMAPMLMSIFIAMSPGLIDAVYGLLLVDERDERTLAVLRVMPVSFARYLAARMATPCVLSILVTICAYPLAGLAPLPLATVAAIALVGGTTVPVVALAIVSFAPNKVAALAVMRVANTLLALPILAYFATPTQTLLAWPIPSYWQMKALWLVVDSQPYLWALAVALALNIVLTRWLYRRFVRRSEA